MNDNKIQFKNLKRYLSKNPHLAMVEFVIYNVKYEENLRNKYFKSIQALIKLIFIFNLITFIIKIKFKI